MIGPYRNSGVGQRAPDPRGASCLATRLLGWDDAELLEDRHAVVESDLLDDEAVDELQNCCPGEVHGLTGGSRNGAYWQIFKGGGAAVGAATFPLADT